MKNINKVDLDSANPEEVSDQIIDLIGCKNEEIIWTSGKTGLGIDLLIKTIIDKIPAPKGEMNSPLQALIFDSVYNPFRGIEAYFKVVNGSISKGEKVKFFATGKSYNADEVGAWAQKRAPVTSVEIGSRRENRYPSYRQYDGWLFPGIGSFMCYDEHMLVRQICSTCLMGS